MYLFLYLPVHPRAPPQLRCSSPSSSSRGPTLDKDVIFFSFFSSGLILQREPGARAIYSKVKTQVERARPACAHGTNARTRITRPSRTDLTEGLVCGYFHASDLKTQAGIVYLFIYLREKKKRGQTFENDGVRTRQGNQCRRHNPPPLPPSVIGFHGSRRPEE